MRFAQDQRPLRPKTAAYARLPSTHNEAAAATRPVPVAGTADQYGGPAGMVGGCEEARQRLSASNTHLRQRITQLEVEIVALREFVKAVDAHEAFRRTVPEDGMEPWVAEWEWLQKKAKDARQTLATDHGIPLPGEMAAATLAARSETR